MNLNMMDSWQNKKITVLAGGVGAARFLYGLQYIHPPDLITAVCNVGDDLSWNGLHVCPDIDTLIYTLAEVEGDFGWGIQNDSHQTLDELETLGEERWFQIGNKDLATHLIRNRILQTGGTLSDATQALVEARNIKSRIIPATNDPHPTFVVTNEGRLSFQQYFVERRGEPQVSEFDFPNIDQVSAAPGVIEAIKNADYLFFAPSNPFVSIDPIIQIPTVRDSILESKALRVGISPIVGGKAIKGPAGAMLESLGHEVSAYGVARIYEDLIDLFIYDEIDSKLVTKMESLSIKTRYCDTMMLNRKSRVTVAANIKELITSHTNEST
ncbi:MAG: 2-phospho-L-lactate transferase [Dehalococcoidia bacterium]|nr:2-phospho-L-lactate transferase [Dehalococcoidia bacterium]